MRTESSSSHQASIRDRIITRSVSREEARRAVRAAQNFGSENGYSPSFETVMAFVYSIRQENDRRHQRYFNQGTVRVTAPSPEERAELLRQFQNR